MTRQVISSGGPLEQTYGYSRAVRVGAHVHVAGTAARGEALAGDSYVQTQNILGTIRSALEQAGATSARPARWCRWSPSSVRKCEWKSKPVQ
jgi:enamine deaminase RidA (YjgF/YER057c/UK114 family)